MGGSKIPVTIANMTIAYTTMISCCVKCNEHQLGMTLFMEMKYRNIHINVKTYCSIIDCCEKFYGNFDTCLKIYDEMIAPTQACLDRMKKRPAKATEEEYDWYNEDSPDHIMFSLMIRGCIKYGNVERALEIYKTMLTIDRTIEGTRRGRRLTSKSGLSKCSTKDKELISQKINKQVYRDLLELVAQNGMVEEAVELFIDQQIRDLDLGSRPNKPKSIGPKKRRKQLGKSTLPIAPTLTPSTEGVASHSCSCIDIELCNAVLLCCSVAGDVVTAEELFTAMKKVDNELSSSKRLTMDETTNTNAAATAASITTKSSTTTAENLTVSEKCSSDDTSLDGMSSNKDSAMTNIPAQGNDVISSKPLTTPTSDSDNDIIVNQMESERKVVVSDDRTDAAIEAVNGNTSSNDSLDASLTLLRSNMENDKNVHQVESEQKVAASQDEDAEANGKTPSDDSLEALCGDFIGFVGFVYMACVTMKEYGRQLHILRFRLTRKVDENDDASNIYQDNGISNSAEEIEIKNHLAEYETKIFTYIEKALMLRSSSLDSKHRVKAILGESCEKELDLLIECAEHNSLLESLLAHLDRM